MRMAPVRFNSAFVLSDLIAKLRAEAHYVRVDPVSTHCLKWPVIFGRSVGKVTGLVRSRTWGPALGPERMPCSVCCRGQCAVPLQ